MIRRQGDSFERPNLLKGIRAKIERSLAYGKRNGASSMPNPTMPLLKDYKPTPVTKVTKVRKRPVTKVAAKRKMGRPPVHGSAAERQAAYRSRKKAKV